MKTRTAGRCAPLLLLALSACKEPSADPNLYPDLAVTPDLAVAPADLATPDLATPDLATPPKACTRNAPGTLYQYVTNEVLLPGGGMTYAIDIDGNGKADNQFAKITGVIGSQFDLQTPISAAVRSGDLLVGMAVRAASLSSACAAVDSIALAKPAQPPRFDGNDQLRPQAGQPAALFGAIGDPLPDAPTGNPPGQLSTVLPSKLMAQDAATLQVQIPLALGTLPLPLQGAHVQARIDDRGLLSGQIHGVISKADVDGKVIPAIADVLTMTINQDPNGSSSKTIIQLFEDLNNPVSRQKCMVAVDCCATNPRTCKILPAEVSGQALIGSFLVPDVQVFDAAGRWAPVPNGANKNGLSVGLGFTAVRATY